MPELNPYAAPDETPMSPGDGAPPKGQPPGYSDSQLGLRLVMLTLVAAAVLSVALQPYLWELAPVVRRLPEAWRQLIFIAAGQHIGVIPACVVALLLARRMSTNFAALGHTSQPRASVLKTLWRGVHDERPQDGDAWQLGSARVSSQLLVAAFAIHYAFSLGGTVALSLLDAKPLRSLPISMLTFGRLALWMFALVLLWITLESIHFYQRARAWTLIRSGT